jgi:cell division septum initiation protein DivIVA
MTTNPPGNDSGTPIHDRTAASEGHEIRPGVTVPSWAATTPLDEGRDADLAATPSAPADPFDPIPADEQLPPVPSAAGAAATSSGGSATGGLGSVGGGGVGGSGSGGGGSDGGKADAAKGAAQDVAGDAKEKASNVAGTAKEQAANVAAEATDHAKQLYGQASENLKEQAADQQQRAAGGLRSIGEQLGRMAENDDEQGIASRVVRDLSGRATSAAGFLENRDPGSLLDEVKSFAAKRPGTFIALAAGAGILAGRLTKALATEIKDEKEADITGDATGTGA